MFFYLFIIILCIYYHNYEPEGYLIHNEKKLLVSSLEEIFSAMKSLQDDIVQKLEEKTADDTEEKLPK